MTLAWKRCNNCGKRISIAEDGLGSGFCILCSMKQV